MKKRFLQLLICAAAAAMALPSLAVNTRYFTVQGRSGFESGDLKKVAVTSMGQIQLAPEIKDIAETEDPFLWCLAQNEDGTIYAGAGNSGRIYKIAPDSDEAQILVDTPEIAITCLLIASDGLLYAGGAPDGIVYQIDPAMEKPTPKTIFQEGEKYVWALIQPEDGGPIYAATGDKGKLYSIAPDDENPGSYKASVAFDADDPHLLSLAYHKGMIYAGSDNEGRLYRVDPSDPKKAFAVYDTQQKEVKHILTGMEGGIVINASTGPAPRPQIPGAPPPSRDQMEAKGILYQILPNGVVKTLWSSPAGVIHAVVPNGEGGFIVGTGDEGKLYVVHKDQTWMSLGSVSESQTLDILAGDGRYIIATGNSGKIQSLGMKVAKEGTWESEPQDAGLVSRWGSLLVEGETPERAGVTTETRSGNTRKPDSTWSGWEATTDKILSPDARYLQIRLKLSSENMEATPTARLLRAAYLQGNAAPMIASIRVSAGEDSDSTQLRAQWSAADPNGDRLEFALYVRPEGEELWTLIEDELTAPAHAFDSQPMPDGDYRLKVTATDKRSNPRGTEESAEYVARSAFRIDNTQPTIANMKAERGDEGLMVSFVAEDGTSYIVSALYSFNGEDWYTLHPDDSIFDSQREEFLFYAPEDAPERGSVAVRIRDAAGHEQSARLRY